MGVSTKILNISYAAATEAGASASADGGDATFWNILLWVCIVFFVVFLIIAISFLIYCFKIKQKPAAKVIRTVAVLPQEVPKSLILTTVPTQSISYPEQQTLLQTQAVIPPQATAYPATLPHGQTRVPYIGAMPAKANETALNLQTALPSPVKPVPPKTQALPAYAPKRSVGKAAGLPKPPASSGLVPTAEGRFTESFPKMKRPVSPETQPSSTQNPDETTVSE